MKQPTAKLIILRGPSASGKSTIARKLQQATDHPTAVIEQDYYKEVMFKSFKKETKAVRHEMIVADVLFVLLHGCNVILDGIFDNKNLASYLEQILDKHSDENYIFYFDVSLEETLRRHQTKPLKEVVSDELLRNWYEGVEPLGIDGEQIIPESSSPEESLKSIQKIANI